MAHATERAYASTRSCSNGRRCNGPDVWSCRLVRYARPSRLRVAGRGISTAMMSDETKPNWKKQATERVFAALNRADEIGGEVRDFLQEKVAADPRYVSAR